MKFFIVFELIAVSFCYGAIDINQYLKTCERNSPDVNECLVDAIQEGLAILADGIQDLGLPPLDPYHQKEMHLDYKNNQIAVKMTMRDINAYGLNMAKVHDVRLRADEDNFLLEVDLTTPKIFVNGTYDGEGGWNALIIKSSGVFSVTMSDLVYTWKLAGKPEKRDGETYVRIDSFYMRPDLGNLHTYITNDNPETRQFTNLGNEFINSNWKTLYKEMLPYAQENWNKIGIRIANKIFLQVPYDQLFP